MRKGPDADLSHFGFVTRDLTSRELGDETAGYPSSWPKLGARWPGPSVPSEALNGAECQTLPVFYSWH